MGFTKQDNFFDFDYRVGPGAGKTTINRTRGLGQFLTELGPKGSGAGAEIALSVLGPGFKLGPFRPENISTP